MQKVKEHFRMAGYGHGNAMLSMSAFHLHQTAETFFASQRLVYATLFPRDDSQARKCFRLLCKAYVDARYNPNYKISDEELQWLAGRMKRMGEVTEAVCERSL